MWVLVSDIRCGQRYGHCVQALVVGIGCGQPWVQALGADKGAV